jgi:hypothetical protein
MRFRRLAYVICEVSAVDMLLLRVASDIFGGNGSWYAA